MSNYFSESASTAIIGLRRRPDLVSRVVHYQGEPQWVCKDPLDQQYQYLNEQEFAILDWLDGSVSYDDLQERFERKFSPYRVDYRDLVQLIGSLHDKSLLVASNFDQGPKLIEMGREKNRKEIQQKLLSPWAVKWKGIDPEPVLNRVNPYVAWFFSRQMVCAVCVFVAFASLWLLTHFDQAMARMPSMNEMFSPSNIVMMFFVGAFTKIVHEFGHAFSFKRFGGECHEIGVMIFFFMPTMYCNTSDSWLLSSKWNRAAVGMGGIYVEMTIFSIATFVWWFSNPGFVQEIAVNLMFLCSLSSVVFNCNPLLKYDGYFVLSDLLEIPNLEKQAGKQIQKEFMATWLGMKDQRSPWISQWNKRIVIAYGILAYLFKMFFMIGVMCMLVQLLAPFGLAPLALALGGTTTTIYLFKPIYSLLKKLNEPGMMLEAQPKRMRVTAASVLGGCLLLLIPFPFYVTCDCIYDGDSTPVYVSEKGVVKEIFLGPGDFVAAGQPIVQLFNLELEHNLITLKGELQQLRHQLEISTTAALRAKLEAELEFKQLEWEAALCQLDQLIIKAPHSGTIIGVTPEKPAMPMDDHRQIAKTENNLLMQLDHLATITANTEICRIQPSSQGHVTVTMRQTDLDQIQIDQMVYMKFKSNVWQTFQSRLESIALESDSINELSTAEKRGAIAMSISSTKQGLKTGEGKISSMDGTSVESSVLQGSLHLSDIKTVTPGSLGIAKIHVGWRSLAWRTVRSLRRFMTNKL